MQMRRTLITLAALVAAGLIGALLFAWSGLYNIAASEGHLAITRWFLAFGMRNSVETHAIGIEVPPLDDPSLFYKGLGHYQGGCAPCHGAPGEPRNPIPLQMLPEPPFLKDHVRDWTPAQLFWIVKHGIKYAGMPAWPAPRRDDEVWAVVAFLVRMPDLSEHEYQRLARGDTLHDARDIEGGARLIAAAGSVADSLVACGRCHGLRGVGGGAGAFPRLAGQKADYLYDAMKSYALGVRPSGIMRPIASELTDEEIRNLAAYYARFENDSYPPKPEVQDARILQLGGAIAADGLPEQRVPACAACHGPQGFAEATNPLYPSIAGQYAEYLALQLTLWKAGLRGSTPASQIMAAVATQLSDEQIRAVSLYYASVRPSEQTSDRRQPPNQADPPRPETR